MKEARAAVSSAVPRSGGWRVWLARVALAIGVPGFLFVVIEGGLRFGGYGHSTAFFIPEEVPGMFRTNPRFTEAFFPASFGLKPLNFRIAKKKPAGEFRIFVVGESAAMGVPEPGFAIAPQLQAQLRAANPGVRVAVYNLGVTAINSHVIVPIVRQAVQFEPDVIVLYMGNNEVVGPFGPSSVVTRGAPPRAIIRASVWLRGWRTSQLLLRVLQKLRPSGAAFKDWRGMEMFASSAVAADDPRLERVQANFAANVQEILARADAAGVPVVLGTVAVNIRDCAPFASRHAAGLTPEQLATWSDAVAREEYEAALAIDPQYAETHYQLARRLDERGEAGAARGEYLAALEWDALRFRADARINAVLRDEARARGRDVVLVDIARELGSAADAGTPPAGSAHFFEHVHFNWEGNQLVARLFAAAIAPRFRGGRPPPLNAEECAAAVGFTDFARMGMLTDMERLTVRPPFTNQLSFAADRRRRSEEIAAASAAVARPGALRQMMAIVEHARQRDPANGFLHFHAATLRAQLGEFSVALELNQQLAGLQPPSPEIAAQQGYLLQELKRHDEAERVLLRSAANDPFYFQTYLLLSRLWSRMGKGATATQYFADLVARMPESLAAHHVYAEVLAGTGSMAAAEKEWRTILRATPDDEAALKPLCRHLYERGEVEAAVALMLAAHHYNPRSFDNNARLVEIFEGRRDAAMTVRFMRDLAASGPVSSELHVNLAALLRDLGQPAEALRELRRGLQVATLEDNPRGMDSIRQMIEAAERAAPRP